MRLKEIQRGLLSDFNISEEGKTKFLLIQGILEFLTDSFNPWELFH